MTTAASLVAFPVVAGIIGGVVAVVRSPSPALVSGVQHFAAGVVTAAVAGEVLPDLRARGSLWLIVVGFSAGVAVLVGLRHFDGDEGSGGEGSGGALPVAFLAVVAVDLFIDGLLVATGATVSRRTALIIALALTVEVLFLGLSVALRLTGSGVPRVRAAVTTGGVSLVTAVGRCWVRCCSAARVLPCSPWCWRLRRRPCCGWLSRSCWSKRTRRRSGHGWR
ncbi:putative membrane protein [Mycobacterium kansasii]|uniref:Putative membrane protein n=1 Tax=Mycobacterium kansasii TaxID=1768 RepID=A0A1V3WSF5_MYCKA|nr:putative membrane protein [Mycobacterium kansasii]OOK69874.1 putative membrane protein [Mycobacterium kansasii]